MLANIDPELVGIFLLAIVGSVVILLFLLFAYYSLFGGKILAVPEENGCSLCGNAKYMMKARSLYGCQVCKRCYYTFANRRQVAFVIDECLIFGLLSFVIAMLGGYRGHSDLSSLALVVVAVFLCKDGFKGHSPGKAMLGLRVINEYNGKPIGLWRSFKRNLPLVPISWIPFGLLFIAVELCKGYRVGDGWSQSKVIWKKFSSNPIFLPKSSGDYVWTEEMKEEEGEKQLSRALKVEIKGNWDEAFLLYQKVVSDFPATQCAKDALVAMEALKEKQSAASG